MDKRLHGNGKERDFMTDNQKLMQEIESFFEAHKNGLTPEESGGLIEKMRDAMLIVPVNFPQDETLAAMQKELSRTGAPVKLPKDASRSLYLYRIQTRNSFWRSTLPWLSFRKR